MRIIKRWKAAFQNFGRWLVAWGSLAAAVPAGFLLSITFVGALVGKLVKLFAITVNFLVKLLSKLFDVDVVNIKEAVPFLVWVAVFLLILFDLLDNLTPNRKGVYSALIWPSLPLEMGGSLGKTINTWSDSLNKWFQDKLGEYLGQSAAVSAAGVLTLIAVLGARQVLRSTRAANMATAAAGATRQVPPVVAARGARR
jgi:amino acid transporter